MILSIKNRQSLAKFLTSLQIPILPYKFQSKQILTRHTLLRILLKNGSDEIPVLLRNLAVAGKLDLVSNLRTTILTILTKSPC